MSFWVARAHSSAASHWLNSGFVLERGQVRTSPNSNFVRFGFVLIYRSVQISRGEQRRASLWGKEKPQHAGSQACCWSVGFTESPAFSWEPFDTPCRWFYKQMMWLWVDMSACSCSVASLRFSHLLQLQWCLACCYSNHADISHAHNLLTCPKRYTFTTCRYTTSLFCDLHARWRFTAEAEPTGATLLSVNRFDASKQFHVCFKVLL